MKINIFPDRGDFFNNVNAHINSEHMEIAQSRTKDSLQLRVLIIIILIIIIIIIIIIKNQMKTNLW